MFRWHAVQVIVRLDVSGVPPQGGYLAKQCPVRAQWDVLVPAEPLPVSEVMQRRFDQGNAFEAEVFAELGALHPEAVVIERGAADQRALREGATVAAMAAGAALIVCGRLPTDEAGRRAGEPDLLVAAPGSGYHPVDVKHHQTLTDLIDGREQLEACASALATPTWPEAVVRVDKVARKTKVDLLQLAHYRRLLEACGQAAAENRAGIIGNERAVTWYDLDAPLWTTPSVTEGRKRRSTMEVYDFEFGFRLDIIETSRRHADDPSVELLVVPVRIGECGSCPWWEYCHGLLEDAGDISLLPKIGWNASHRCVHARPCLVRTHRHLVGAKRQLSRELQSGSNYFGKYEPGFRLDHDKADPPGDVSAAAATRRQSATNCLRGPGSSRMFAARRRVRTRRWT